ncbi:hypothetical protein, partial [Neisseria sp. HMSC064E01]|uniref:hypothetical protein n=1 Tax=Neisseria sp. HMSC064E01 TaxID=1715052 RepID=UPI001AEF71BB
TPYWFKVNPLEKITADNPPLPQTLKTETHPFPFQTTSRPFFPQNRPTSGASDETPSRLTGLVKIMDTF